MVTSWQTINHLSSFIVERNEFMLTEFTIFSIMTCHTTNDPPTISPPGPSVAAFDGLLGPCTAATLGPGGPSMALSITTVGPP